MLTQYGVPGLIIGWASFSPEHSVHGFHRNFFTLQGICLLFMLVVLVGVELLLCVVVTPS